MRVLAADMLKCQSFPSVGLFIAQSTDASVEDAAVSASSSASSSSDDMGLGELLSTQFISRSEFMESAKSLLKVYIRGALLDDDCSNSNVAIDNKIEQAMDLVKSHLMFAVREEVEILKEQIKELLEKNQQLEYENDILRADATPETLAKLETDGGSAL